MYKRIITCLLVIIILIVGIVPISVAQSSEPDKPENDIIGKELAASIALLFVAGNTDTMSWGINTNISYIRPLYDSANIISYYCIGLAAEEQQGYVVISTRTDGPLIVEFSDRDELPVEMSSDMCGNSVAISEIPESETLYYSPLYCSTKPINGKKNNEREYDYTSEQYLNYSNNIIQFINDHNLLYDPGNPYCDYHLLSSPVSFINEYYPGYTPIESQVSVVSGTVPDYSINLYNGCAVYATAAIIQYYGTITYPSVILNTCKTIAESGFALNAASGNYYINDLVMNAYVDTCVGTYYPSKNASCIFSQDTARAEINNNRPCLFNIAYNGSYYIAHTVTVFGWSRFYAIYGEEDGVMLYFYHVKDGDCDGTRYICGDSIIGLYIIIVQ